MTEWQALLRRLGEADFPRLGGTVGEFLLYDSILAGYLSCLAKGTPLESGAAHLEADDDTLKEVAAMRSKPQRTQEEEEFLAYWNLLEEIRAAVTSEARRNLRR